MQCPQALARGLRCAQQGGGQDRAVCGSWLGPPEGRGARRMSVQGRGGPCRSGHVEQRRPQPEASVLSIQVWGFPVCRGGPRPCWRPAQESQGHGPGGGRQRPPSRAPSSRPLLFIGNTLGAARALWWRLPAKGRRGHAFRHSQSRVLIHVSTTHRCLISPPHPLPAVPTPQDSREHLDSGPWEMTGRQGVGTVQ